MLLLACGSKNDLVDSMPDPHQLPPIIMGPKIPSYQSCSTHNVYKENGGLNLINPRVHLIFWGNWDQTQADNISNTWGDLFNNYSFWGIAQEYGAGIGLLADIINSNSDLSLTSVSDAYIRQELASEIYNKTLPAPDNNSIYVVLLPNGTQSDVNVQYHYSGYHGYSTFEDPAVIYSVIGYNNTANINITISHEVLESTTDPDTITGYRGELGETEIGDFCNDVSYVLNGISITKIWSQAYCKCIP